MSSYSTNNTQTVILNRMIGNISNDVDTSEGSLTYDALSPASNELAQVYIDLDQVANKFDLSNLSGDELVTRIYQRTGLTRNVATYATGTLSVTGTGTINQGTIFQTLGAVQFESTATTTITGNGTITIQAVIAGSSGNIPAGQITDIPVSIAGISNITNSAPTTGGYDAETDSALLERYYEQVQTPATSGNSAQFKAWAKSVSGVGDAKVFPLWNGNNTVKVVIIDVNKQPPSTDLVTQVQNYIDPSVTGLGDGVAPIGAFTTIAGATANTINVSFSAVKDSNYTDAQRLVNVQASISSYLTSIAFNPDITSISYGKIGAAILASAGILDYSNLTVNGGAANIALSSTATLCEVPVLGVVTIA